MIKTNLKTGYVKTFWLRVVTRRATFALGTVEKKTIVEDHSQSAGNFISLAHNKSNWSKRKNYASFVQKAFIPFLWMSVILFFEKSV